MSNFTVIPGSSLPPVTTGDPNGFIFFLTPIGGGNFRLDRIERTNFFKLAATESIDLVGTVSNLNTLVSIDGVGTVIYDSVISALKQTISYEIQDGSGFMVASINADGTLGLQGSSTGQEIFISGANRASGDQFLPSQPSSDGKFIGMGTSVQELVPVNSASDAVLIRGNKLPVLLSPAGAINPYDIELSAPANFDDGTEIIFHNPTGNNITGLTWTLNGATNGSLPTSINGGTTSRIMLFGTTWYEL